MSRVRTQVIPCGRRASGSPRSVNIWITALDASAPNSTLSGPRITSMRSNPADVRCTKSSAPPGSVHGTPSSSTRRVSESPPRANTDVSPPLRPGLHDGHARHVAQQVLDECAAGRLEIFRGENIRRDAGLLHRQGARVAVTTHDRSPSPAPALRDCHRSTAPCAYRQILICDGGFAGAREIEVPRASVVLVSEPQATCAPSTGRPLGSDTTPRT